MTVENMTRYFKYLDSLRAGGSMNMFEAAPYLARAFSLERKEASKIWSDWVRTFSTDQTVEQRAHLAVSGG